MPVGTAEGIKAKLVAAGAPTSVPLQGSPAANPAGRSAPVPDTQPEARSVLSEKMDGSAIEIMMIESG